MRADDFEDIMSLLKSWLVENNVNTDDMAIAFRIDGDRGRYALRSALMQEKGLKAHEFPNMQLRYFGIEIHIEDGSSKGQKL